MISVVIATRNDGLTLGQTLASLVPAAVDALVREVILADAGSTDDTLAIAEDAGARIVRAEGSSEARLAQGCEAARSDWLLILEASESAPHGWEPAARRHMEHHAGRAAQWGRSLVPFALSPKAVLVPRRLYDKEAASAGWLKRLGGKARALKIRR
jgi:glycosyltransferase involved in cell wall biosynthesis